MKPAPDPGLRGALRDPETNRDLAVAEPLVEREDDRVPLVVAQLAERPQDLGGVLGIDHSHRPEIIDVVVALAPLVADA